MPVELRIVEKQLEPLALALVGELLERIAMKCRPVDDVIACCLGGEHREAVMMPAGNRDVSNPRTLGHRHPRACVEFHGIECRCEPLVAVDGDAAVLHHPLAFGELTVDAPVDE